jgi:hypothetical protein
MANIWKTLGLDGPSADVKTIKRAYAAKLKVTRPEDDAEGFMALREAFSMARNYARYHAEETEVSPPSPAQIKLESAPEAPLTNDDSPNETLRSWPQEIESQIAPPNPQAIDEAEKPPQIDEELPRLLTKVDALLDSPIERNKDSVWGGVFTDLNELSIDDYTEFGDRFLYMLIERVEREQNRMIQTAHKTKRYNTNFNINTRLARKIFATLGWLRPVPNPHMQHNIDQIAKYFEIIERPYPTPQQQAENSNFSYWWVLALILFLIKIIAVISASLS